MTRPFLFLSLALVATLWLSSPAMAQSADAAAQARELKAQADEAMQRIEYERALDLYDKAYGLDPSPALLYNRGRAYEALARYPEALDQLEEFERTAPAELKAKVSRLDALMGRVRARVSQLEITCNVPGARVLVRAKVAGTTPIDHPLRLNSGKAVVEVSADGYHPFRQTLTLTGGGKQKLEVKLVTKASGGLLVVGSPVAGATVFVDGKRLGAVPVQTVLPPGKHRVVVHHDEYEDADTRVEMVAGRRNEITVPLDRPPGLTSRWWFWTGVGVVAVGGGVLVYALLTEREADRGDMPPGQVAGPLVRF
ncbi:MAG: PEGA domain-containing protein [Polyangiaceae bacterium]|nr:PEGA domain-containing protein [Polyangiaceae bacterium]